MLFGARGIAATFFLLAAAQTAAAAISIQYTVVPVGGNVYRYVYSLTNSAGSPAVQLFDILFDTSQYQESSLTIVTPPPLNAQWQQQILHSVAPSIPAAYDALSLSGGIPAGSTVTGFAVQFTWLGTGTPGPQPFQVFDSSTFALLQSGTTAAAAQVVGVPGASPFSLGILGIALAIAAAVQKQLRTSLPSRSR
jgi:hypothetical protein